MLDCGVCQHSDAFRAALLFLSVLVSHWKGGRGFGFRQKQDLCGETISVMQSPLVHTVCTETCTSRCCYCHDAYVPALSAVLLLLTVSTTDAIHRIIFMNLLLDLSTETLYGIPLLGIAANLPGIFLQIWVLWQSKTGLFRLGSHSAIPNKAIMKCLGTGREHKRRRILERTPCANNAQN